MSCDSEDIFICQTDPLECIEKEATCNGIAECSNGHDESVQTCGKSCKQIQPIGKIL